METKHPIVKEIIETIKMIAISFVCVWVLTTFFIRPVQVVGDSMYPTLHDGELGFTSIISLSIKGIERNDVVVANLSSRDEQIVKRVIGMPGDSIWCEDGKLYVNGVVVNEYYLDADYVIEASNEEIDGLFTKDFDVVSLGDDEYFLLGDNRLHSSDSRVFGVFKEEDILSKHVYVWYPFKEMRVVK